MPDIDVDFCLRAPRRGDPLRPREVRRGPRRRIITFGTLKGKAAIKDVGRVLEFSFGETDKHREALPGAEAGEGLPAREGARDGAAARARCATAGEREQRALRLRASASRACCGTPRKHAAGIVIANKPLSEDLPLFVDKEGAVLTQYSMNDVEWIGLIKFDFLGLKTLTFLADAVTIIRTTHPDDPPLDLATLPLDDAKTYKLLAKGDTVGIFQMESGGMRKMITQLRPSRFEDLIAALALFRPGPLDSGMDQDFIKRKHGKEKIVYDHPLLEGDPAARPTASSSTRSR